MKNIKLKCMKELGYALMYMKFLHPDIFFSNQEDKIYSLCHKFAILHQSLEYDSKEWKKFLKEIKNETENMC